MNRQIKVLVLLWGVLACCADYSCSAELDFHYKFATVSKPTTLLENTWGSYQTDLFSGSFGYGFPIKVPPGVRGLQPDLQLNYNSHSARGKSGWVGAGWDLPVPYIQRDIEYTRRDPNDDSFDLHLGGKHDLVFVAAEGRYRTSVETFFKIEAFNGDGSPAGGGKNPAWWVVRMKDGTQYRFGRTTDARKVVQSSDASFAHYNWRWHLDAIIDTNGNTISYQYQQVHNGTDIGAVYLSRITYNTDNLRTIDFVREANPCAYLTINQGSEEKLAQRLKRIDIKVSGALVRQYVLTYAQNSLGTNSLLTSIQEFGTDGATALPPTTFSYQGFTPGFSTPQAWGWSWNTPIRATDTDSDGNPKVDTIKDVIDVNGDGLPDRAYESNGWKIRLNTGNGFSASESEWSWNISHAFRDMHKPTSPNDSADTKGAPMDMNRDGYLDYVHAEDVITGGTIQINFGGPISFGGIVNWASPTDKVWVRVVRTVQRNKPDVKDLMMDINGDGYPDFVRRHNDTDWGSWLGTGAGFGGYQAWKNPVAGEERYLWEYDEDNSSTDAAHETLIGFYDMNGDGLDDVVDARGSSWKVYINTGSNFIDLIDSGYGGSWSAGEKYTNDISLSKEVKGERHDLFDINGDGLPDKVLGQAGTVFSVLFNTGSGFIKRDWTVGKNLPDDMIRLYKNNNSEVARDFIDLNGDGLVDMVSQTSGDWEVSRNLAQKTDLMTGVKTSFGGTVAIGYTSSRNFANTRLPFNYWLVSSVSTNNGMGGDHAVTAATNYSYEGGLYDFPTREFRGFSKVTETMTDNTKVEHHFHQGVGNKGKEKFQPIFAADGRKMLTTENIWTVSTPAAGVNAALLTSSEQKFWEGSSTGDLVKRLRTEYANHDPYGNARLVRQLKSGYFFPESLFEYSEYSYNTSAWIVDKPSRRYFTEAEGGVALRSTQFGYDGKAIGAVPDKGNLTRQVQEIDTGDDAVTQYAYDAYGNQVSVTDPEGRVSTTGYDSTYHTFPITSRNAKNQLTQRTFVPATGALFTEKDPNGFGTIFMYDNFHRQTMKALPYDSWGLPTESRSYAIDGTAPEHVKVSKRETSGTSAVLESYQVVDGFGNLIQAKTESGTTANQIAVNYFYDKLGRLEKQGNPLLVGWADGYTTASRSAPGTSYVYDALGRPVRVNNPDGTYKLRTYLLPFGVKELDENNHEKTYYFNGRMRPEVIFEKNGGEDNFTYYKYNIFDDIVSIRHPAKIDFFTQYSYDSIGRKTLMIDPDLGSWSYVYDRAGNLVTQTDARKKTIRATYDPLNRKLTEDYPGDADVTYVYDTPVIGTLSKVLDGAGEVSYEYDQRLRKTKETRKMDGFAWITEWTYDAMDRVVSEKRPNGEMVTYTYDSQGLLDQLPGIVSNLDYNATGQVTSRSYASGETTLFGYHPQNLRLTSLQASLQLGSLLNYTYQYDKVGNITLIDNRANYTTETYTYDDLNRLKTAAGPGYSLSYTIDSIGNIQQVTRNGKVENYYYGKNNALPHAPTLITNAVPVIEQFAVNQGAPWTVSRTVSLTSRVNGTPTEYQVSESSTFANAQWLPYKNTLTYQLANTGYGDRTVYFKVRNAEAESEVSHARITYAADSNQDNIPDTLDADRDGMLDSWELLNGLSPTNAADAALDPDGDGLTNRHESMLGSNPQQADSDGDQVNDGVELWFGSNPILVDTDGDGLADGIDLVPTSSLQDAASKQANLESWYLAAGGSQRTMGNGLLFDSIGNGLATFYFNTKMENLTNLNNSIFMLRIMSGLDAGGDAGTNIDVNKDGKIGLPEAVKSLQNVAKP